MKKILFVFLLLIILLNVGVVYGETTNNKMEKAVSHNEESAYKLLYTNIKETNSKILNTVYWALSSILVVIVTIIGSNIYYNYKFNKRESEKLKQDINNYMKDMNNELTKEIGERFNNFANETRKELKQDVKDFADRQEKELERTKEYLNSKIQINSDFAKDLSS